MLVWWSSAPETWNRAQNASVWVEESGLRYGGPRRVSLMTDLSFVWLAGWRWFRSLDMFTLWFCLDKLVRLSVLRFLRSVRRDPTESHPGAAWGEESDEDDPGDHLQAYPIQALQAWTIRHVLVSPSARGDLRVLGWIDPEWSLSSTMPNHNLSPS